MAGMLPGVECARRRRFHLSGGISNSPSVGGHGWTRRSSFCLYTSNHETHLTSSSSLQSSTLNQTHQDEKLGGVAKEAKERLDERLRTQRKSETTRKESLRVVDGRSMVLGDLHTEVFGSKKSGSKRFSWAKLRRSSATSNTKACIIDNY